MFFLNFSLAEFIALFGAVSAVTVALYLLDRSRRRQVVATLRFWTASGKPSDLKHRKKIQQPLSLILQLAGMLLLLLALGQLRWGSPERASRDHVVILDTSAWMAARTAGGTLLDEAKRNVAAYLRALPPNDRAMLVRADALATPATRFEWNRKVIEEALRNAQPGASALNLEQALEFAREVQRMQGRLAGEIVFAGAGRISGRDALSMGSVPNLRVLPVSAAPENCGLRKIGLRRAAGDPLRWEILVTVRNFGSRPRRVPLGLYFGNAVIGSAVLALKPGEEHNASFSYRTRAGGWLEARIEAADALAEDNRAVLELPPPQTVRVLVYSREPELLRPLLAGNPLVEAIFRAPAAYDPKAQADIHVFDRFQPPSLPEAGTVWIEPPSGSSPFPIRAALKDVALTRWTREHELGTGLHFQGLRLDEAEVYRAAPGDIAVAECEVGPIILARPGRFKTVAFGFHPVRSALRYELTTPLLFANVLRWMAPRIFQRWELNGGYAGTVTLSLGKEVPPGVIRVVTDHDRPLPFTVQGNVVRFFAGAPQTVRLSAGEHEYVYSLTLPDVAETTWEPPRQAKRGIPPSVARGPASRDTWQLLAALGALVLVIEWFLYGRGRFGSVRLRLFPWRAAAGGVAAPPRRKAS